MFKRILFLTAIAIMGVAIGAADQAKKKIVVPVNKTNPTDAKQMYGSYCAPCHGTDGKGNGPVAGALKSAPTDLTTLARQNDGKFPDAHIAAVLRFGADVPAHGSATMPIWGHLLDTMEPINSPITELRIANLTQYLETLQHK